MTDSSGKQMQDIEALLAERRKFDLWLDQLDGRRTATPSNVYAKVHADYSARLAEAQSRLAAETGAVEALVEKLESSLETHDATIAGRSDELAEAELRASVGEYAEKEWNKLRDKLSLAIAEMTKARDTVLGELEAMRAVLAEASSSKPAQIVEESVVHLHRVFLDRPVAFRQAVPQRRLGLLGIGVQVVNLHHREGRKSVPWAWLVRMTDRRDAARRQHGRDLVGELGVIVGGGGVEEPGHHALRGFHARY